MPAGIATAEGRLDEVPTQARQLVLFPTVNAEPGAAVRGRRAALGAGCFILLSTET